MGLQGLPLQSSELTLVSKHRPDTKSQPMAGFEQPVVVQLSPQVPRVPQYPEAQSVWVWQNRHLLRNAILRRLAGSEAGR